MVRQRNNFRAGLFVVIGVTLAFITIVVLADVKRFFRPMQTIEARFAIIDGIKGLKAGANVTIGGSEHGRVLDVADEVDSRDVVVASIVKFTIPSKYKIYENAHLELNVPPLGSGTSLNIRSFGGPATVGSFHGKGWEYEYGIDPPIAGGLAVTEAVTAAVRELGIEDLQRQQIKNVIANADRLLNALGTSDQSISQTLANVQSLTGTLKDDVPKITGPTREMVAATAAKYSGWLDKIGVAIDSAGGTLDNANKAVKTAQQMLDENRQPLKDTIANTQKITDDVNTRVLAKVHTALDKANEAVANVRSATAEIQTMVTLQRPVLERTIANARLTSDQLKLASIEIRRSPWRLLYTPSAKELDSDNLYDAARSFALAAGSLNSTADSMQSMLDRYGTTLNAADPNVKLMLDNLHQTLEKFTEAESKFWKALDGQSHK